VIVTVTVSVTVTVVAAVVVRWHQADIYTEPLLLLAVVEE